MARNQYRIRLSIVVDLDERGSDCETLPNSVVVVIPAESHGVLYYRSSCAVLIAISFLESRRGDPNTSCLDHPRRVYWETGS